MAKKVEEKIRVHNKGKREFTYPPSKPGGEKRLHPAGRAIELEEDFARKMIKAYPNDLIEFDSLVSGEKKNLSKEVTRLEDENKRLKEKIEKLEATKSEPKPSEPPTEVKPEPKEGEKPSDKKG